MNVLISSVLLFSLFIKSFVQSSTSSTGTEGIIGFNDENYLITKPYNKEQIEEVRSEINLTFDVDPDEYLSVKFQPELIAKYGYPVEEHFITTKDGYILGMHRIPPKQEDKSVSRKTVFLMHGLLVSSTDWIILGPQRALAYLLSDLGYDVWMGNARGNTYSRNHTTLNPNHRKFWKFSWHEIGIYDLPAMIDYALKVSNQSALYYVGHSQGTTSFFVMCSELPEYNEKIIAQFSLAPVAYMQHTYSPIIRLASKWWYPIQEAFSIFGTNEFLSHTKLMTWVGNHFCRENEIPEILCRNLIFLICGFDMDEFNATKLPLLLSHAPAGSSVRQIIHYFQLMNSTNFSKYNYAPFNKIHYGPSYPVLPPPYKLENVKAPVYLYYSKNDWLSNENDVMRLCDTIKKCSGLSLVTEEKFNHVDFIWGIHAKEMVYDVVIRDMEGHDGRLVLTFGLNGHEEA